jgi:hypothetical protein
MGVQVRLAIGLELAGSRHLIRCRFNEKLNPPHAGAFKIAVDTAYVSEAHALVKSCDHASERVWCVWSDLTNERKRFRFRTFHLRRKAGALLESLASVRDGAFLHARVSLWTPSIYADTWTTRVRREGQHRMCVGSVTFPRTIISGDVIRRVGRRAPKTPVGGRKLNLYRAILVGPNTGAGNEEQGSYDECFLRFHDFKLSSGVERANVRLGPPH